MTKYGADAKPAPHAYDTAGLNVLRRDPRRYFNGFVGFQGVVDFIVELA